MLNYMHTFPVWYLEGESSWRILGLCLRSRYKILNNNNNNSNNNNNNSNNNNNNRDWLVLYIRKYLQIGLC